MFTRIHNIAIVVKNVEEAVKLYTDTFGFQVSRSGTMPELGIKNAFLPIGDATIELMEPIDTQQGPVAKFLENRGEGIYLIELEVEDMDSAIQSLSEKGVQLLGVDPESRAKGRQIFIHPRSSRGVLIELIQKK